MPSDAQAPRLIFLQNPVKDYLGPENSGEKVDYNTYAQRDGKPLYGTGAEHEQNESGYEGRYVGIKNSHPRLRIASIDGCPYGFAKPQLFPDPLKNKHVRINAYTHGEYYAGDAGKGHRCLQRGKCAKEVDHIHEENNISHGTGGLIVENHEKNNQQGTENGGINAPS